MTQQRRKRSDSARELFDAVTYPVRNDFLIDLQFLANRTSSHAQVAVLCAPPEHKAEALRAHYTSLVHGLFGRVRESFLTCVRVGLSLSEFEEVFAWADQTVGTDIAWALIPGSMQFRYNARHPRARQPVSANEINALSLDDNLALEEIPYPLRKQQLEFYLQILHAWLPEACRTPGSEWASWLADVQTLLRQLAAGLQKSMAFASSEAWDHLRRDTSLPTERTKPEKSTKLPPKKLNLSSYLEAAKLTKKQEECCSLRFEYGLSQSAIARRLAIDRSTVSEHIALATRKLQSSQILERSLKKSAKSPRF